MYEVMLNKIDFYLSVDVYSVYSISHLFHFLPISLPLRGLQHVLDCQTQPELDEIAAHFTADYERFGSVVTIELIKGGKEQTVTIENKKEYVESLAQFHMAGNSSLNGCLIYLSIHMYIDPLIYFNHILSIY